MFIKWQKNFLQETASFLPRVKMYNGVNGISWTSKEDNVLVITVIIHGVP
jgi:hypothetical protein